MMAAVAPATLQRLELLWESMPNDRAEVRGGGLPPELARRYGGPLLVGLRPDRPTVVANLVSTIDGIVALGPGELSGGRVVSGSHEPDRFVMALLRALAEVVLVGAGTLRQSSSQRWTAEHLQPQLAPAFEDWRRAMGLAPRPTTVIVTGSGDIPIEHPGLTNPELPVVVATSLDGARRLARRGLTDNVSLQVVGGEDARDGARSLDAAAIVGLVGRLGARVALAEGGPHALGELVRADLVDDLFLTVAPQLVGRAEPGRLGLVEGVALPSGSRWQELASVRRSTNHLFLRYRRAPSAAATEA
jgi:riboflavin biosynthesis pyrimidine reductase